MQKYLQYYKNLNYTIEITEEDNVFFISIEEFNNNLVVESNNLKNGLDELDIIFEDWIEAAIDSGIKIPEPKKMGIGDVVEIKDNYPVKMFIGKGGIVKKLLGDKILVEFKHHSFWIKKEYLMGI